MFLPPSNPTLLDYLLERSRAISALWWQLSLLLIASGCLAALHVVAPVAEIVRLFVEPSVDFSPNMVVALISSAVHVAFTSLVGMSLALVLSTSGRLKRLSRTITALLKKARC